MVESVLNVAHGLLLVAFSIDTWTGLCLIFGVVSTLTIRYWRGAFPLTFITFDDSNFELDRHLCVSSISLFCRCFVTPLCP